jgi:flagellin-like hook-associated protein FlgL
MSVGEVKRVSVSALQSTGATPEPRQVSAKPSSPQPSTDSVDIRPEIFSQRSRLKLNASIEATNVAAAALDDITRLVGGIEGILEQASSPELSEARKGKLNEEANQLRSEIIKAAERSTSDGVRPLSGDKIRIEVEETLGRALEVILPDTARGAFGIRDIRLDTKELIIDTAISIQKARESIESLRKELRSGVAAIEQTFTTVEVARENREAASASIRDVNEALKVAFETNEGIKDYPEEALASVGQLQVDAAAKLTL